MSKFKFGNFVNVNKTTSFEYNDANEKVKIKHKLDGTMGVVLRLTRKATGDYQAGSIGGGLYIEYEQSCLIIKKWHPVYEVALSPKGVLVFVEEEDMNILECSYI